MSSWTLHRLQKDGGDSAFLNIAHEVTHSASEIAGTRVEQELAERAILDSSMQLDAVRRNVAGADTPLSLRLGSISSSTKEILDLNRDATRLITAIAQEEVIAQTGALEMGRLVGLSDAIAEDPIISLTGYMRPKAFKGYVEQNVFRHFGPLQRLLGEGWIKPQSAPYEGAYPTVEFLEGLNNEIKGKLNEIGSAVYTSGMRSVDVPLQARVFADQFTADVIKEVGPEFGRHIANISGDERTKHYARHEINSWWTTKSS